MDVSIRTGDFDVLGLQAELASGGDVGAVASFVGLVREESGGRRIDTMELEHYPGMTERSIQAIVDEARTRWKILGAKVVHRVGPLKPGDRIVYVGVAGGHRDAAFRACEFIMDYLKTRAPFWKKEFCADGSRWVDARASDELAARRWEELPE